MNAAVASAAFMPAMQAAAVRQARRQRLVVAAGQGFASKPQKAASSGSSKKQQAKLARYLDKDVQQEGTAGGGGAAAPADGWIEMPGVDVETTFLSKPIKPIILATGRAVCLYKVNDKIYASDANSTAYQYPLADASILSVKGAPAVEVPLDGTVYDLATGKVLSWCPKNNLTRKILGGLKDKTQPVPLPVYPVELRDGGKVYVKFA